MKNLKMLGLAAIAAMALTAFTAGSASATTLEVGGTAKNEKVELTASLKSGTSVGLKTTSGAFVNTCASSQLQVAMSSPFTGTKVTGPMAMGFGLCSSFIPATGGSQFYFEHIFNTTNGTVFWENGDWTVSSPFGQIRCKTGTGTHIGTLTGASSGHATLDINAVLNCGFLAPSTIWEGTYTITSPTGLGVVA